MNRQVGACYTLCVAIVVFFAVALRPEESKNHPAAKPAPAKAAVKSVVPKPTRR